MYAIRQINDATTGENLRHSPKKINDATTGENLRHSPKK